MLKNSDVGTANDLVGVSNSDLFSDPLGLRVGKGVVNAAGKWKRKAENSRQLRQQQLEAEMNGSKTIHLDKDSVRAEAKSSTHQTSTTEREDNTTCPWYTDWLDPEVIFCCTKREKRAANAIKAQMEAKKHQLGPKLGTREPEKREEIPFESDTSSSSPVEPVNHKPSFSTLAPAPKAKESSRLKECTLLHQDSAPTFGSTDMGASPSFGLLPEQPKGPVAEHPKSTPESASPVQKKFEWPKWATNKVNPAIEVFVEDPMNAQWIVAKPMCLVLNKENGEMLLNAEYEWPGSEDMYDEDFPPTHVRGIKDNGEPSKYTIWEETMIFESSLAHQEKDGKPHGVPTITIPSQVKGTMAADSSNESPSDSVITFEERNGPKKI